MNSFVRGNFHHRCSRCCEGNQHTAEEWRMISIQKKKKNELVHSGVIQQSHVIVICHMFCFTLSMAFSMLKLSTIQFMFTGLGDRSITSPLFEVVWRNKISSVRSIVSFGAPQSRQAIASISFENKNCEWFVWWRALVSMFISSQICYCFERYINYAYIKLNIGRSLYKLCTECAYGRNYEREKSKI